MAARAKRKVEPQVEWPAYNIERRAVADLVPYAKNARLHSPEQVEQIAKSIDEFGWTMAVLVDEANEVIAGHGRILAAAKRNIRECPVIVARGWTEAQKRAYRIFDNKSTENSEWIPEVLKLEFSELQEMKFDLALTGFKLEEVEGYLRTAHPPDEFAEYGDDIETEHECPKCGYRWSGGELA